MRPRVLIPDHPLISQQLAVLRDKDTTMPQFRAAMLDLGRWLTYECCRDWLPVTHSEIETPLGVMAPVRLIDPNPPMDIVPILRAGLAMVEECASLLSTARIYHVGYRRNEDTREAECYLSGLPQHLSHDMHILIPEPMLATGGTLIQVVARLEELGADAAKIRVVTAIASEPALDNIGSRYPDLVITCAAVDAGLDDNCYIVPGLGDAGDRAFGTEDY